MHAITYFLDKNERVEMDELITCFLESVDDLIASGSQDIFPGYHELVELRDDLRSEDIHEES